MLPQVSAQLIALNSDKKLEGLVTAEDPGGDQKRRVSGGDGRLSESSEVGSAGSVGLEDWEVGRRMAAIGLSSNTRSRDFKEG